MRSRRLLHPILGALYGLAHRDVGPVIGTGQTICAPSSTPGLKKENIMDPRFEIEPQGGHEYLIRAFSGEQVVESRFTIDSDVLRELGLDDSDEQHVVEQAARLLAQQQSVLDFPALADVRDIIESYEGLAEQLRSRVTPKHGV